MTSTANDTQQNQPAAAPLTWTGTKEWGSTGLTHRAITKINGETWKFTVDSPRKGEWHVRAWRDGDLALYREDRTMKGAKQQAQEHVNYAATQTCGECREIGGHTLACSIGLDEAVAKDTERGTKIGFRAEMTEVQDETVITLVDEGAEILADQQRYVDTYGTPEIGPAVLKQLDPAEAEQLMAELEETFPHLAEWKQRALGEQLKQAGEQMQATVQQFSEAIAPAIETAAAGAARMAEAIRRVQSARDRVQMRKDTCGCPTPLHTMRCGFGGQVRVVRKGAAL